MALDMRLLDFRGGGEAGAQAVAAEGALAFAFGQIAANTGGEGGFLNEAGDVFIGQALRGDTAVLARDGSEQGAMIDAAEPHPGLEQGDRAGSGREPRPISTSRQPVLPLMVSSRPPSLRAPESGTSSSFPSPGVEHPRNIFPAMIRPHFLDDRESMLCGSVDPVEIALASRLRYALDGVAIAGAQFGIAADAATSLGGAQTILGAFPNERAFEFGDGAEHL